MGRDRRLEDRRSLFGLSSSSPLLPIEVDCTLSPAAVKVSEKPFPRSVENLEAFLRRRNPNDSNPRSNRKFAALTPTIVSSLVM